MLTALLALLDARSSAFVFFALGLITSVGIYCGSIGYRTFYYLPHFTAGAGTILLWMQLYNPNFGLINQAIIGLGNIFGLEINPPGWLTSTKSLVGFLPWPNSFNNGADSAWARAKPL